MTDDKKHFVLPPRELIARVRDGLDAAGHRDISISELWVNQDRPGLQLTVDVRVGAALVLPLKPLVRTLSLETEAAVEEFAAQLILALPAIKHAEKTLVRYADAVRRAARREIAAARADGLDLSVRVLS